MYKGRVVFFVPTSYVPMARNCVTLWPDIPPSCNIGCCYRYEEGVGGIQLYKHDTSVTQVIKIERIASFGTSRCVATQVNVKTFCAWFGVAGHFPHGLKLSTFLITKGMNIICSEIPKITYISRVIRQKIPTEPMWIIGFQSIDTRAMSFLPDVTRGVKNHGLLLT